MFDRWFLARAATVMAAVMMLPLGASATQSGEVDDYSVGLNAVESGKSEIPEQVDGIYEVIDLNTVKIYDGSGGEYEFSFEIEGGELIFDILPLNHEAIEAMEGSNWMSYQSQTYSKRYMGARSMASLKESDGSWFFLALSYWLPKLFPSLPQSALSLIIGAVGTLVSQSIAKQNHKIDLWIADKTNAGILATHTVSVPNNNPRVSTKLKAIKCPRRRGKYVACQRP